jgi:hypothetical protein
MEILNMFDDEDIKAVENAVKAGWIVTVILTNRHRARIKSAVIDGAKVHFDIQHNDQASLTVRRDCIVGYAIEAA